MHPNFANIVRSLADLHPQAKSNWMYKITPYSLNTKASFSFENYHHWLEFMQQSGLNLVTSQTEEITQSALIEWGIDPDKSFWVNFYKADEQQPTP